MCGSRWFGRGGLEHRSELDRATCDIFGRLKLYELFMKLSGAPMDEVSVVSPMDVAKLLCGRTMVFRSRISVGVIADGSTS